MAHEINPYYVEAGNSRRWGRFRLYAKKTGVKRSTVEIGLPTSDFDPIVILWPNNLNKGFLYNDGTGVLQWKKAGSNNDGTSPDTRSGIVILDSGVHVITFQDENGDAWPLGIDGTDWNLFYDAYDTDNATPSYSISNRTKFGFAVEVYEDNIRFGWKAELKVQ